MKQKRIIYVIFLFFMFSHSILSEEKKDMCINYLNDNVHKLFFVSLHDYHSTVYGNTTVLFVINIVDQGGMIVELNNNSIEHAFLIKYDIKRNAFIREKYFESLLLMSHYDNLLREVNKINFKVIEGEELYQLFIDKIS